MWPCVCSLTRRHDMSTAAASVVADKTLEVLGLFLFALAGMVVLFESGANSNSATHWAIRAVGATFAILSAFLAAQRWGLLKLVDKAVKKFSGSWGSGFDGDVNGIHDAVWAIYSDIPRLILAAFLHALAWVPGALQIWAAMHFMGFGIGFRGAFVIESLTMIACSAAFMMPAALGAQETAYMTVGWWLFGIPPAAGLALSLIMRMKDILFGVPGLIVWQVYEGNRLWTLWRRGEKRESVPPASFTNQRASRPTWKRSQYRSKWAERCSGPRTKSASEKLSNLVLFRSAAAKAFMRDSSSIKRVKSNRS